jgi:uncharacterized membrane protein YgdD (TMEM256/DUF423 family)
MERSERRTAGVRGVADEDFDGGHRASRLWGHLLIGFAVADAYLIRQRLMPELVQMPALARQVQLLGAAAVASLLLAGLVYLCTRRTSRARTRVYLLGAVLFAGITSAMIVADYHRFAVPGTFTARMELFQSRVARLWENLLAGLPGAPQAAQSKK